MNNYYYIITGLPFLTPKGENKNFSYKRLRDEIYSLVAKQDRLYIEFLERGFDEQNLDEAFYREALKSPSKFIREYFALDLRIRNLKVISVASKLYKEKADEKIATYSISIASNNENSSLAADKELEAIFDNPDILEKEKQLDDYKWLKINALTVWDYFDRDLILAFLAKASIVERWQSLSKTKGEELFRKLINQVRGTFDKNKLTNKE